MVSREQRIEELRRSEPLDEGQRRELAECVVEAASDAGQSGDVAAEHDYIDALGERADSCDDPVVREAYASALANSTDAPGRGDTFIDACSDEWLDTALDRLEQLVERHRSDQLTTTYTRALANRVYIAVRADDGSALSTYTELLSDVADEDDPRQSEQLARGLAYRAVAYSIVGLDADLDTAPLSIETLEMAALGHDPEEIPEFDRTTPDGVAKHMGLYINAPDQSAAHRQQAAAHADTHYTSSSTPAESVLGETISTALDDINALYRRHDTDALAVELARTMRVVAITHASTGSPDRYNTTLERMGDVYEAHPVNGVACQLIATVRVGLVEDSVRLEHPRMHHWVGRVMESQDLGAHPALASGIGDCLTMLVEQLFRRGNYGAGETAIDRIETLEPHAPERYRAALAEALATAVTGYLADSKPGYSSAPNDAEKALDRLETLANTHDDDRIRDAYRDAHVELMEYYIGEREYDVARSMFEGDTPAESGASDAQNFPLLVFLDAVTDDDGITGDYHRPPLSVPSVESSVLAFLCAVGLVGGLVLAYQQAGIGVDLFGWSPGLVGRALLWLAGGVGLTLVNKLASATPPYSVYVRPAVVGFVLTPGRIEAPDGHTVFTWTLLLQIGVPLILLGSAVAAPSLLVPVLLVIGCWVLGLVVLFGYTLHLKGNYNLSPAVSTRLSPDAFEALGVSPREAERLLYDRFTGFDDDAQPSAVTS